MSWDCWNEPPDYVVGTEISETEERYQLEIDYPTGGEDGDWWSEDVSFQTKEERDARLSELLQEAKALTIYVIEDGEILSSYRRDRTSYTKDEHW